MTPLRVVRRHASHPLCVVVALVLCGCGFHLRTWDLAASFESVAIDADASVDLDRDLAQALASVGVRVVERDADLVLTLARQSDDRRSVAVTATALAAVYELSLQVTFGVVTADGEALAEARELRGERSARLDRDNVIGSSEEQALLMAELRNDLVGRMMRTLGALSK